MFGVFSTLWALFRKGLSAIIKPKQDLLSFMTSEASICDLLPAIRAQQQGQGKWSIQSGLVVEGKATRSQLQTCCGSRAASSIGVGSIETNAERQSGCYLPTGKILICLVSYLLALTVAPALFWRHFVLIKFIQSS